MGFVAWLLLIVGLAWAIPRRRRAPRNTPPADTLFEWTEDRKFEWYLTRRSGYSSGARDSYSRYDQTIASVSAGAIVLSITFLKDIGYTSQSIPWLYGSWISFLAAGGLSLYSLRTSADSDIERLAELERLVRGKKPEIPEKDGKTRAEKLGESTVLLNRASLGFCLLGITLAMMFAFLNYPLFGSPIRKEEFQRNGNTKTTSTTSATSTSTGRTAGAA
jgi:hypothetical protein